MNTENTNWGQSVAGVVIRDGKAVNLNWFGSEENKEIADKMRKNLLNGLTTVIMILMTGKRLFFVLI